MTACEQQATSTQFKQEQDHRGLESRGVQEIEGTDTLSGLCAHLKKLPTDMRQTQQKN